MFDRIVEVVYTPIEVCESVGSAFADFTRGAYWIGYILGLIGQFLVGFAIGTAVKVAFYFLLAIL